MASELLVKRLMMTAGVSVLAGLLLSSAVMAQDNSADADDTSISIDDGGTVSIDPVDPGEADGEDGGVSEGEDGSGGDADSGDVDGGEVDGGEITVDPECAECSGVPDVSIDPVELGEPVDDGIAVTTADGPTRGTQPNQRGEVGTDLGGSNEVSHERGRGSDADQIWKRRLLER